MNPSSTTAPVTPSKNTAGCCNSDKPANQQAKQGSQFPAGSCTTTKTDAVAATVACDNNSDTASDGGCSADGAKHAASKGSCNKANEGAGSATDSSTNPKAARTYPNSAPVKIAP